MAGHQVKVSVVAETKNFKRAFRGLSKDLGLNKLTASAKKVAGTFVQVGKAAVAAGAAASAAFAAISFKAIQMAGDLEQSTGAVEAIFKESADKIKGYASTASTNFGITRNEFQELATLLGAQLKNGGTPLDQLGDKTKDLITLGADLSAQFGGTTAEAIQSISSALKGERDPIEKYGVSLKQASIDAKAAELGFKKVGGSFSNEAQQAATLALIFEQTADAQGAFNRENNTYAHQVQVLKAKVHDLAAEFGTLLLPYATQFVQFLNEKFMPKLDQLKTWLETVGIPAIKRFAQWLGPKLKVAAAQAQAVFENHVMPALQAFKDWWNTAGSDTLKGLLNGFIRLAPAVLAFGYAFKTSYQSITFLTTVPSIIGKAANAFKLLLPIIGSWPVLIAAAIAAVIGIFVYFYQHSETFRNKVTQAWEGIKTAATVVWDGVKAAISPIINWFLTSVMPSLQDWGSKIIGIVQAIIDALKPFAIFLTGLLVPVVSFAIGFIQGMVKGLVQFLSGLGSIFAAAWQTISAVISGALQIIQGVFQVLAGLFTGDWSKMWEGAKNIAFGLWNAITGLIQGAVNIINNIIQTFGNFVRNNFFAVWNGVKNMVMTVWNLLPNGIRNALSSIGSYLSQIPSMVMGAFSGAGSWLLGIGEKIINGLIQGIKNMFGRVKESLTSLTNLLPSWKGPAERDKTLLVPAGRLIIGGLINSLESQYGAVRRSLTRLTGDIASTNFPSIDAQVTGGAVMARDSLAGATINVYALNPTVEVGRLVARALAEWQAQNGDRR